MKCFQHQHQYFQSLFDWSQVVVLSSIIGLILGSLLSSHSTAFFLQFVEHTRCFYIICNRMPLFVGRFMYLELGAENSIWNRLKHSQYLSSELSANKPSSFQSILWVVNISSVIESKFDMIMWMLKIIKIYNTPNVSNCGVLSSNRFSDFSNKALIGMFTNSICASVAIVSHIFVSYRHYSTSKLAHFKL